MLTVLRNQYCRSKDRLNEWGNVFDMLFDLQGRKKRNVMAHYEAIIHEVRSEIKQRNYILNFDAYSIEDYHKRLK